MIKYVFYLQTIIPLSGLKVFQWLAKIFQKLAKILKKFLGKRPMTQKHHNCYK